MQEQSNPSPPVPGPPPGRPQPPADPRVGIDSAVARLNGLEDVPLGEHVERFEAVHTELTVALSSIDKV